MDSHRYTRTSLPFSVFGSGYKFSSLLSVMDTAQNAALFKEVTEEDEEVYLDFEQTLEKAGTSCFQYILIVVCGLMYMSSSVSAAVMGFILPATKCKLHIMSHDRGIIISSGLVGMVFGTLIWGALSDMKGRKLTLLICLGIDTIASIATAFSFHKHMLLVVRFFNGVGSIGVASIVFAYAGDFIVMKYKDYFLATLEAFWGLGLVFIPLVGMFIIPHPINKDLGFIKLHSWNVFALACAILPLTAFLFLLFLPESPQYLIIHRKTSTALEVLRKVYSINHPQSKEDFKVFEAESRESQSTEMKMKFMDYLKKVIVLQGKLFKPKHRSCALKIFSIALLIHFSFLTISIWIPTLLDRHDYEKHIDGKDLTFCDAATHVGETLEKMVPCNDDISEDVYHYAIIICVTVFPFAGGLFIALNFMGRNELLMLLTLTTGISCMFLNFVVTKREIITCCIFFQSSADLIEVMLLMCVVHYFPQHLCATALTMTVLSGRLGAIIGNSMFGALIDKHCDWPMGLFTGAIFLALLLQFTLPRVEVWE